MFKYFFLIILLIIGVSTFVLGHELTHVALNDFRVDGVCVLNCLPMNNTGVMGNSYTPIGVYLNEPKNELADDESIAHLGGFGLASVSLISLGVIIK